LRDQEEGSETEDENFFESLVTIEILLAMSGDVSVRLISSQERMVVVSATNGQSAFSVGRSGHVERFGEVVVFPTSLGPEETLITDFIDHF